MNETRDMNLMLILIVCVGLIFCSMLLFRGNFDSEIAEIDQIMDRYLGNVTYAAFHDAVRAAAPGSAMQNSYVHSVALNPPPDAVTAATPRIISWINDIILRAKPAIVGICVGDTAQRPPWQQGWTIATPQGRRSVGSGVIVHPDGYIVTNYHVVALSGGIVVSVFNTNGYRDYPATLISGRQQHDLALLKITKPDNGITFPFVSIGDSDKVAVGDKVIAIGNPFGLTQTTTSGIISARRQRLPIGGIVLNNVFQTDVPINPGNSGGALLNLRGEVIGINTAIYSPVESVYTGVSFAVPMNDARQLFGNLVDFNTNTQNRPVGRPVGYSFVQQTSPLKGRIQPSPGEGIEELAWLGIDVVPENDSDTTVSEVAVDEIEGITPMEAGLQAGDIIRSVNGYPTPNIYEFKEAIKLVPLKVGQGVMLDIYRPRNKRCFYISFRLKKWDVAGR